MDKRAIERIVKEAASTGRKTLAEPEAKEVLKLASVAVPRFEVVKDVDGALAAAGNIGYPVVLKIISPDVVHKSDVGGVAVGIKGPKELQDRWSMMVLAIADDNPVGVIEGFMIEEMAPGGAEVIIGAIDDEQFGPVVMFGAGGVAVELTRDVSFRLAPVTRDDAFEMMSEVKGYPLLTGFRGDTVKDLGAIAEVIMKLADLVGSIDGLREFEINPLVVYENGAVAVDARAVLG